MNIAIIGWGSLIWDPRNLEIDKTIGQKGWLSDGPKLPIEFSRISNDRRLTLVIDSEGNEITTLYSISLFEELNHAILNLSIREGCGRDMIGHFRKDINELLPSNFHFGDAIKSWIYEKEAVEAVIWTNLSHKLWYIDEEGDKIIIQKDGLIRYLENLSTQRQAIAEEYIRRTPQIVDTPIRKMIESEMGWNPIIDTKTNLN